MALKDKLFTKVFSNEGTERSQQGKIDPMSPANILPIQRILITGLIAAICILPFAIILIRQSNP